MFKQAIIVNKDSKIGNNQILYYIVKGSLIAVEMSKFKEISSWFRFGQKKVTLTVNNIADLLEIIEKCKKLKLNFVIISSNGQKINEFNKNISVLAIGPDKEEKINNIVGHLKLF